MFWNDKDEKAPAGQPKKKNAKKEKSKKESLAPQTSMASVQLLGRWTHRARRSKSHRASKPNIAFIPEDGVTDELLQLEEKLEHDHHRKSYAEALRRTSEESDRKMSKDEPAGIGHHSTLQHQQQVALLKTQESWKPGYDSIPRPFRQHMVEIEKRRARKIVEILNSPDEVYSFSAVDKRIRYCPHGTLIFHVLELVNVLINASTFSMKLPISYYCVLSVGPLRRTSKIVHSPCSTRIRMDYTSHFSVEVPEWRESPLNRFKLEFWTYQDPELHYILGSTEIHMYEFVRKQHAIQQSQLWSDGIKVGKVYYEFAFSYGYFGYGHSNHLKNPKNPLMETVCHSMYPRICLDSMELLDKLFRVRMPEQLKVFTFNSLILEISDAITTESKRKQRLEELDTKPIMVQQVSYEDSKPIHCKVYMSIWQKEMQPDFCDGFGEFICLGTRKTRMDYMYNFVQGRMRDLWEEEAGPMFRPFKDKEAERIQKAEINHPGYLVHPLKFPCPESIGTPALTNEDEQFCDKFPAVRRGSGYLNLLLGYDKNPQPKKYVDQSTGEIDINDLDYPLYKEAGKIRRPRKCCRCKQLRKCFLRIGAFLNWIYNFIFPEVRKPPQVPEVSVTTPTPQGSTSKVYTYFVRDSRDGGMSKLDKIQQQTNILMELANKPEGGEDEDSDNSSSSSDGDGQQLNQAAEARRTLRQAKKTVNRRDSRTPSKTGEFNPQPKTYPPKGPDFEGPGGHFKKGINQSLL